MPLARVAWSCVFAALIGLAAHAALAAPLSASDKQIYGEAFAAAKRGDWGNVFAPASRAQDQLPATTLHWLQDTRAGAGASFADITAFVDAHPDWPQQKLLLQRAEEAIGTATDTDVAAWFGKHPPMLPAARLRLADIWVAQGRTGDAEQLIRKAWIEGNFSAVEEKLMLERYRGILRGEDNAARLDRLIWDKQYEQATHMLKHVAPDTAALGQARLGLATMNPGAEGLIARVPASLQKDPGLLFERLRWRRHKNLDDDAATILEHPPADLGRPEAWASERLIVARRLLDDNETERAYRLADKNGLDSGATFSELEFLAGWIALRDLKNPALAYNHFVRLYDAVKLPISLARGAYWSARAAEAMGQVPLAQAWYASASPFIATYYGQLAAQHLGSLGTAATVADPQPSHADVAAFERNELVQAARDLATLDDTDDLPPFLRAIADAAQTPSQYELAAQLARAVARPDMAILTARRASYAGVTLFDEAYPVTDLPPGGTVEKPLVLAMTRQESAFDQRAVSSAGALGLMQLMPATASRVAKLLNLPFSASRLTTDISYNVTLGRAYLDSLVDDFSGSYVLAVAAYNAGPGRVHQWMADHGDPRNPDIDVVDWIERIPVTETRNYVQRVLENLQIYRLRLGANLTSFSLAGAQRP